MIIKFMFSSCSITWGKVTSLKGKIWLIRMVLCKILLLKNSCIWYWAKIVKLCLMFDLVRVLTFYSSLSCKYISILDSHQLRKSRKTIVIKICCLKEMRKIQTVYHNFLSTKKERVSQVYLRLKLKNMKCF